MENKPSTEGGAMERPDDISVANGQDDNEAAAETGAAKKRVRGRRALTVTFASLFLVAAAFLAVYYLVPRLLPWSEPEKEAPDPSAMLDSFRPAEAMKEDTPLVGGGYAADNPPWGDDDVFSLLIIGNDYDYSKGGKRVASSAGRADTIMLLLVPRQKMSAALVSIPRDTMVTNAAGSSVKINSLYRAPVPSALSAEVSRMTGISVDRWVSIDFSGFVEIVDILGGVEIEVQKRMKYTDVAGGYHIDLSPGLYHFDGQEALRYVRYRSDAMGDVGRVERQLGFVRALADKAASWDTAGKLFALLYSIKNNIQSDLSFTEAFALGVRLLRTGMGAISTWKVPGSFNGPYWQVNRDSLRASISKALE